jgi:hypothetical protein
LPYTTNVGSDGGREEARRLGERNWSNAARNRDSWQKLLKKALVQKRAKMGRWCDGRCQEVGGREIGVMLQGIGTDGRNF